MATAQAHSEMAMVHTDIPIAYYEDFHLIELFQQLTANGTASMQQSVSLAANTVVRSPFMVKVSAGRADWALAANVAQLRNKDIGGGGQKRTSVIIDFGVPRTVSGVGTKRGEFAALMVRAWMGAAFGDKAVAMADLTEGGDSLTNYSVIATTTGELTDGTLGPAVIFPSDIRAERLQVDLLQEGSATDPSTSLVVQLPDAPADLDLRIDGGTPVWSAPGPVAAGSNGWIQIAGDPLPSQSVDLSDALTKLLGDPAGASDAAPHTITLSARVPGALALALPSAADQQLRYIANAALSPADAEIKFDAEGKAVVNVPVPSYATSVESVRLTIAAKLPPERTLPPLGPDAAMLDAGSPPLPVAEMVLDVDRAAAVELFSDAGLAELSAIRLPLRADAGGAEVRVLLLAPTDDGPGAPIEGGTSAPATLDESATDGWISFAFKKPVPIDESALPYVAIIVSRGTVRWSFTADVSGATVWSGAPAGPWERLPALEILGPLKGRLRLTGHARPVTPIAPLTLGLGGDLNGIDVTPTPKGVSVEIDASAGAPAPIVTGPGGVRGVQLNIVSRVAGAVTLTNAVVIVSRS